jgi:hypothetical protein
MTYYDGFSHYQAENILHSSSRPAHSGPEVCNEFPKSIQADTLAREVVLGGVSLITRERPAFTSGGGSVKGLRFGLK